MTEQNVAARDEYGNVIFEQSGDGDQCPVCMHPVAEHEGDGCGALDGYDHLNGFHECGCPLVVRSSLPAPDSIATTQETT